MPGLVIAASAFVAPGLRHPDGFLLPQSWLVVVGGMVVSAMALTTGGPWSRFGRLVSLAAIGQACGLQLMNAPNYGVYQEYFPWPEILGSWRGYLLAVMAIQTIWVLIESRDLRRPRLRAPLPITILLAGVVILAASRLSTDLRWYAAQASIGLWFALVNTANLWLAVTSVPDGKIEEFSVPVKGIALWVLLVGAGLSWFVFERIPHIEDDISYLFQAKYFSTGRLYMPSPPVFAAFDFSKFFSDGTKWWSYGFPAWPAVLALGVIAGAPWLVNPILGAVAILLAHALLRRLFGARTAMLAILLLAASPWFLFMSATFMPHPLSAVWTLTALLAVERSRERPVWGLLAGVALGGLFLTRPFEALQVGPVVGLWALWGSGRRPSWAGLGAVVLGGAAVASLLFGYSKVLTGDPFYPPHQKYSDEKFYHGSDRLGFGPAVGNFGWNHLDPYPGHALRDVVQNDIRNVYQINYDLFGWAFGSLAFVVLFLARKWSKPDWLFAGLVIAVAGGHTFYWFSGGPDHGARYWYQALIPLVVLTARGIESCQERRAGLLVGLACALTLVNFVPWRSLGKYHRYRGLRPDIQQLAQRHGFGNGLVFIKAEYDTDYLSAMIFSAPTLDSPGTVYARDLGPEQRRQIARSLPGRRVWLVEVPPLGPYRVVAGPLAEPPQ